MPCCAGWRRWASTAPLGSWGSTRTGGRSSPSWRARSAPTPLPTYLWADTVPDAAARSFVYPDGSRHEVIRHNDAVPYNGGGVDGRLIAFIDFDTSGPGPRRWDLAHAADRFIPPHEESPWRPSDQARRLRRFCDAYGLVDR